MPPHPPPHPLSFRKKATSFLNFNIKSLAKLCTACSESLQHTSNMKTRLSLFVRVALEFFFLISCTVLIFFFFFFYRLVKLPVLIFLFFSSSPPLIYRQGLLLHLLVLPHFFRVFVLPDKHRDVATSEALAFMNILALMRGDAGRTRQQRLSDCFIKN